MLVWSVSRVALAKEDVQRPRLADRIAVLEEVAAPIDWLEIDVTDAQLLSDIAAGFDVIVMGADKWQQIHDPVFYGNDPARRDASIAALPAVAIASRPPHDCPAKLVLDPARLGGRRVEHPSPHHRPSTHGTRSSALRHRDRRLDQPRAL